MAMELSRNNRAGTGDPGVLTIHDVLSISLVILAQPAPCEYRHRYKVWNNQVS